jgi:hypothetical protein
MTRPPTKPQPKSPQTDETCEWTGASGERYKYYITPISNTFKDVPGNYIYAMRPDKEWKALYIGETSSLSRRPEGSYEKEREAVRFGATHVHAHFNSDEDARKKEQDDLIQSQHPPFNRVVYA